MSVASFAEIGEEFHARTARIAWATGGPDGAPGTRILHPIWEEQVGWIVTTSGSPKIRDLSHEPRVSLTYWDAEQDNVHVEAVARVAEDQADRDRIWDLFAGTEPPLGYDPGLFWPSKTDPAFALLRFEPIWIE